MVGRKASRHGPLESQERTPPGIWLVRRRTIDARLWRLRWHVRCSQHADEGSMSMSAAAVVIACALDLLGRSASRLPPIEVLVSPPPGVSANAEGFADRSTGKIYVIASAPWFAVALSRHLGPLQPGECRERDALKVIASIIVHEEWHLRHGPDERGAYYAQLTELGRLGLGAGTWATQRVTRAMLTVLRRQAIHRRSTSSIGANSRAAAQGNDPHVRQGTDTDVPAGAPGAAVATGDLRTRRRLFDSCDADAIRH